ncbi:MAG: hypothetical protein VZR95_02310 [Alphaproteobacteria bacterium]
MDKIEDDEPIDDILKSVRNAIVEKERKEYFKSFLPKQPHIYEHEEVFELSKAMLVNREDLPYQLGMWNFDVVAKKMLKKYKMYFMSYGLSNGDRVRVKEEKNA